ncbi:MAG: MBL fold metallo-hydrolase [Bacteroidetes bacterium]|jgi:L-ascorbate metabolism protein UlaG (beta-lactamase superfamily)|nr:MBL fold metallo-hydrolase [Bacteroidota bacterium]
MTQFGPVTWLGHASFRIDDTLGRVYVDPWKLPPESPPADLILVTHAHDDHFSPDDLRRIRTSRTLVCCTADVANMLEGPTTVVKPDMSVTVGPWSVATISAGNQRKAFHPLAKGWVGYVLTLGDGRRLLHTGDTDALPHHDLLKVDIALLPCGGTYTMDGEEAGCLAQRMAPGTAVPMHWGDIVGTRADAEKVLKHYSRTIILDPARR